MQLDELPLGDPDVYSEGFPYEWYDRIRREDPVHWTEDPIDGVPFWAVTKHADILKISRQNAVFHDGIDKRS